MKAKDIYSRVARVKMCSEREFLFALDTVIRALIARYGERYVCTDIYGEAMSLSEDIPVYDEYFPAIVGGVTLRVGGGADEVGAALASGDMAEAEGAFRKIWSECHSKKLMRGWGDNV